MYPSFIVTAPLPLSTVFCTCSQGVAFGSVALPMNYAGAELQLRCSSLGLAAVGGESENGQKWKLLWALPPTQ